MTVSPNALFAACMAPTVTLTENGDRTNASSTDARVDFFYQVQDTSSQPDVCRHLASAWQADAEDALRLLYYVLDVRNGKSATMSALYGLHWLMANHPKTFLANLSFIKELGCIRDFATLLMMARCEEAKEIEYGQWRQNKPRNRCKRFDHDAFYKTARQVKISPSTQTVHSAVVQLFVNALVDDKKCMVEKKQVSLFSKWLPSQDSYLNRSTRLFDDVALALYQGDGQLDEDKKTGKDRRRPLIHARNYLRKTYISPLRKYTKIVERQMSERQWDKIKYAAVPSNCMARNGSHFEKHDEARYIQFLQEAALGKSKINAAVLKPHEICFPSRGHSRFSDLLADAQWNSYVAQMDAVGTLSNCLAVCDVSGSMSGQPMNVCVSLGLLVATLAKGPWKDHLITFSADPQFHLVQGTNLSEKLNGIMRMDWGMNTNFDGVFDVILERAQMYAVQAKDMPTTIFVFSDMQFDSADPSMTTTAFQRISAKYVAAGYEMPQIVFWNLRDSVGVPVTITDEGTALVSGFSGNLLKLFLEGGDFKQAVVGEEEEEAQAEATSKSKMSPLEVMRKAIDQERFAGLRVVD